METPTITRRHGKDGAEATEATGLSRLAKVRDMKGMRKLIQLPCGSGVRKVWEPHGSGG